MLHLSLVNRGHVWGRVLSLLVVLLVGTHGNSALSQQETETEKLDLLRKHVLATENQFEQPKQISGRDAARRETTVNLDVQWSEISVQRPVVKAGRVTLVTDKLMVRTYNGSMIAPLIRLAAGDLLKIKLTNSIPKNLPDPPGDPNTPQGFNRTNLHTHGLHVSPEGRSDNVYLDFGPGDKAELCFDIPAKHVAGTFWIHPHRHESTALQLSSGMAGALIVDPGAAGGIDDIPEIGAAMKEGREKILVFQQLMYLLKPDGKGEVTKGTVYGGDAQYTPTLINGVYAPTINMRPGEVQRWRCIHGGVASSLNLAIGEDPGLAHNDLKNPWDLNEIAADGLPAYEMKSSKNVVLWPGYRSDFLVQAPSKPGQPKDYLLTSQSISMSKRLRLLAQAGPLVLARIHVDGMPNPMKLPAKDAVKKYSLPPIDEKELFNKTAYKLDFDASNPFTINGQSFDRDRIDLCPRLGTAEEWLLTSSNDLHPVHIHVNPFEVIHKDGSGKVKDRQWRDTILIDENATEPTYIRLRFEDYPGKTVLHCHNLVHEDQGMMMAIRFVGKAPPASRCPSRPGPGIGQLPAKEPAWALVGDDEKMHRSKELAGQTHLLVFYRGVGCVHCRRQLTSMTSYQAAFTQAGIKIVVIGPDDPQMIRKFVARMRDKDALPGLHLADPLLEAFQKYGCVDEIALHGIFLVDEGGVVRWQYVGDEPYLDMDNLLVRCRTLAPKKQP